MSDPTVVARLRSGGSGRDGGRGGASASGWAEAAGAALSTPTAAEDTNGRGRAVETAAAADNVGALTAALAPPLFRHVAPHVPLLRQRSTASGAAAAAFSRIDAALCEVFCLLLTALPRATEPSAVGEAPADAKPSRAAKKDKMEDGALPSTPTLEALCQRLSSFLCEELGGGGQPPGTAQSSPPPGQQGRRQGRQQAAGSARAAAAAAAARDVPALLRSARLLLGGSWAAEAHAAGVPRALLEFWESAPLDDRSRRPLLRALFEVLVPLSRTPVEGLRHGDGDHGDGGGGDGAGGDGATTGDDTARNHLSSTFELRARFLKSLPRLLRQLQDTQPALSLDILRTMVAIGRVGDELRTLQPALVPYFCATRRRGQPDDAPPLLGPFCTAPPRVRQTACHLLARFHPLSSPMAEALAACASESPGCAPELLRVVADAARRGGMDGATHLSFVLTVALEVCANADAVGGQKENEREAEAEAEARRRGKRKREAASPAEEVVVERDATQATEARAHVWKLCADAVERMVVSAAAGDDKEEEEGEGGTGGEQGTGGQQATRLVEALRSACEAERRNGGSGARAGVADALLEVATKAQKGAASA